MQRLTISKLELDNMELAGLSEEEIAGILDVTRMGLFLYRKRNNWPQIKRSDIGKERTTLDSKIQSRRECQARYRQNHPDKWRNYHDLNKIFINTVGRPRKKGEVIHHIDGNPHNNARTNLVICTQSYHMRVLHKHKPIVRLSF